MRWIPTSAALGVATLALLTGCTGVRVPFTPGPSFSPTGPAQSSTGPARAPDVDLTGVLQGEGGTVNTVHTEVWFDPITTAPRLATRGAPAAVSVQLPISGRVTVTNTGTRADPVAGSVVIGVYAVYPARSTVCSLVPGPQVDGSTWTDLGCWWTISFFNGVVLGDPGAPLQPGQQREGWFGVPTRIGITLGVDSAKQDLLRAELTHPANVVVLTSPRSAAPSVRFARACPGAYIPDPAPSVAPTPPARYIREQHAVVGSLHPGSCADWPPI